MLGLKWKPKLPPLVAHLINTSYLRPIPPNALQYASVHIDECSYIVSDPIVYCTKAHFFLLRMSVLWTV